MPLADAHPDGTGTGDTGSVVDGSGSDAGAVRSGTDARPSPAAVSGSGGHVGGADCCGHAGGAG
jgi:hypothetical protein